MWNIFKARLRDWRYRGVILAVAIAYGVTIWLGYGLSESLVENREVVWLSFYASWVQDIIFFSLVGIAVIAYTAPYRADSSTFDERVMAFYGTNSPKLLRDYAKDELQRFGGYSPSGERTWTIKEFDAACQGFKVEMYVKQVIKNIFDVDYSDAPETSVIPDKFDNPPSPLGEIEWIAVNDQGQLPSGREEILPDKGWRRRINLNIPAHGEITLEAKQWLWIKAGEECGFKPNRVVEKFDMVIRNSMNNQSVIITIADEDGGAVTIAAGQNRRLLPVQNVTPNDRIFVVILDPPDDTD